jgi:hypothetical protein
MSRVFEILCSPSTARAAALALMTIGVAACSANTSRSNTNPEATGSISQTETPQVQPHQNSGGRRRSPPTSNSTTARPAATPDITGSLLRKPTSAAKWRRNGDTAIKVAAAATPTVRRAEATSTEARGAAADFAASRPDLPTDNSDARKPATTNNSYAEREQKVAEEEMPLIWPVLTEAQPAGPPDSASESVLMPAFLAGALLMVLLCVGAIFKARSSLGAGRAHLLSFFQSIKFGRSG